MRYLFWVIVAVPIVISSVAPTTFLHLKAAAAQEGAARREEGSQEKPKIRELRPDEVIIYDEELVTRIQSGLNSLGYDAGEPDGKFGPRTESAIRQYQRDNSLREDGRSSENLRAIIHTQVTQKMLAAARIAVEGMLFMEGDCSRLTEFADKAENGDAERQSLLAGLYLDGVCVEKDIAKAVLWYQKAASAGFADAQFNLGIIFVKGEGVRQDYRAASRWFRKSAEQGDDRAQAVLGSMYASGEGVPQNYEEAAKWLQKAAEQGNSFDVQSLLGTAYFAGAGVSRDYQKALHWFSKAAENGSSTAMNKLGVMYLDGLGVPENYYKAYVWLNLAAASMSDGEDKDLAIEQRNEARDKLSQSEVIAAQREAEQWVADYQ